MSSIVDIDELGRRIRKLRLDRRMTLKQVEVACGLSATHLSEIERGRTSPTIGALVRIARSLEKDASYFIEQEERPEIAHLLREQDVTFAPGPGVTAEALSPGIPGSGMSCYRLHLTAGNDAGLTLASQDLPGEAIYYVRSGDVTAAIGDSELALSAGDAVQATLAHPHHVRASGTGDAEIYLVCTRALEEPR